MSDMEDTREKINTWLSENRNPYDFSLKEKVYWTMVDLQQISKSTSDPKILNHVACIYERLAHFK